MLQADNIAESLQGYSGEEKILELHAKKREVAADFLEGTANVASEAMKLTEQELLDLLG